MVDIRTKTALGELLCSMTKLADLTTCTPMIESRFEDDFEIPPIEHLETTAVMAVMAQNSVNIIQGSQFSEEFATSVVEMFDYILVLVKYYKWDIEEVLIHSLAKLEAKEKLNELDK